jgi:hypothetical protein
MSGRRPVVKGRFEAVVNLSGAVMSTAGLVTRTEFGRAQFGSPNSDSCRGGGLPRPVRFVSEDAERAAGRQMALDVESVLDRGVNGQKALG